MSKNTIENEYKVQKEIIQKTKAVVLYGNSIVACIMEKAIKQLSLSNEIYLFDNGRYLHNKKCKCDSPVVILCSSRKNTRLSMREDTKDYFASSAIFDFFAIYYQWIVSVIKRKCDYNVFAETLLLCRNEECIHNIDSINTLYCNLRCKECSNGVQYRKSNKRIIKADSQVFYLERMTRYLPICQCNFQGGEVFTDVHFSDFIEKHATNPRVAIFTIATNGTMLPGDDVFRVIRDTGCMIRISDYGPVSRKKADIMAKCEEFNIPCFTFPFAEQWRRFGEYRKRNRPENELKDIQKKCCFGTHDMMFVDDKIYCCLRTLFASAVEDSNDAMIANTLDLDSDFTKEQLLSFVRGDNLWKMCDYCDYPMEVIEPAEQLK